MSALADRRGRLLAVIEADGGLWSTGQVKALYRRLGWAPCRTTARGDLQALVRLGLLVQRGPDNDRAFTLNLDRPGGAL